MTDHHPESDWAFARTLELAREGDEGGISALFEEFYAPVHRMVHASLAGDIRSNRPWLAARFSTGDVVQEVFRCVLGDLGAFRGDNPRAFAGYLTMVVRNRIVDAIRFHEAERRDGRRAGRLGATSAASTDEVHPARAAQANDELARVRELLDELPERERLLLRARIEGTATFKELAERLGYPSTTTARRAYFEARARLAVRLGYEEGEA